MVDEPAPHRCGTVVDTGVPPWTRRPRVAESQQVHFTGHRTDGTDAREMTNGLNAARAQFKGLGSAAGDSGAGALREPGQREKSARLWLSSTKSAWFRPKATLTSSTTRRLSSAVKS